MDGVNVVRELFSVLFVPSSAEDQSPPATWGTTQEGVMGACRCRDEHARKTDYCRRRAGGCVRRRQRVIERG